MDYSFDAATSKEEVEEVLEHAGTFLTAAREFLRAPETTGVSPAPIPLEKAQEPAAVNAEAAEAGEGLNDDPAGGPAVEDSRGNFGGGGSSAAYGARFLGPSATLRPP